MFLVGEADDEFPDNLAKLDICMGWVETQLYEYRAPFNKVIDTIIKTYLSNGAEADGSYIGSASSVPPSPSPSCTTSQWV